MTPSERMNFLQTVFNAIFTSKAQNTNISQVPVHHPAIVNEQHPGVAYGRSFVKGTLRGYDVDLNIGDRIIQIRCLEQNPNKTDASGNLKQLAVAARQGHQIMWVIDRQQENGFLGRIQNGTWIPSEQRAVKPANPPAASPAPMAASASPTVGGLPVRPMPQNVGIPEYVVTEMEAYDYPDYDPWDGYEE